MVKFAITAITHLFIILMTKVPMTKMVMLKLTVRTFVDNNSRLTTRL